MKTISENTKFCALSALSFYRDDVKKSIEISKALSDAGDIDSDVQYWKTRLDAIEAAIAELTA
jgi:hypothetical protein